MSTPPASPTPRGLEQVQREAFTRLYGRVAKIRLVAVPVMLLVVLWAFLSEMSAWRRWAFLGLLVMAFVGYLLELYAFSRKREDLRFSFLFTVAYTAPFLSGLVLMTGGVQGPMTPLLVVVGFFITFFVERRTAWAFAVMQILIVWGFTWLSLDQTIPDLVPTGLGGGARVGTSDNLLFAIAGVLTFLLLWVTGVGTTLRGVFRSMVTDALDARDEVLRIHTENLNSLTTMSGEIAHELKNPLASVKGLAAMIARDVEGKPAERLAVLRREVDRMQEILEGFLNFSRPLMPLHVKHIPLQDLCRQVVELHEGMASQHSVALRLFAEHPVAAWCDPRKVKQVLINLVQNALEASPRGGMVELVLLRKAGDTVQVEVRDRGPGVAGEVRSRVFEPGVTTKPKGSGLGLSIARALARQHGGELTLCSREGGGCVAELVMPTGAPPQKTEAAA